jgi:hypothetical protein
MSTEHPLIAASSIPEPFVSADEAAKFLSIKRRFLLALARRGIAGAYAIGSGNSRRTWVFRLSELGIAIDHRNPRPFRSSEDKQSYDPFRQSPLR